MRKKILLLSFAAALPFLNGCAGLQRPLTDAALGGGGAFLGDKLSGGNPAAIAGGAAGGVLLGEGIQALKTRTQQNAYSEGYNQGRSDGVKHLYWNLQDQQRNKDSSESYRLYDVTIPEHLEDGALVKRTHRTIRIQE